jgi:hypothetical protein
MRPSTLLLHASGRRRRTLAATRSAAAAAACLQLAGCFTLTPIRLDSEIEPGRLRIHLTDSGVARAAGVLGERVRVLDGEVARSTAGEIVVLVPSSGPTAFGEKTLYQELRLSRDDVTALERRRLDRMRTGLTVGGAAAIAGFLLYESLSGKTGSTPDGGGGGPAESRVPLFRISIP